MTAMLSELVNSLADEFTALLADAEPANDDGEQLIDRLWSSGLLDIPGLVELLLRRAQEERIAAGVRAARPAIRTRFVQGLVGDSDAAISAAAMALILARSRRRDRFDGPRLSFDDLSAEAGAALLNAIAAALRLDLVRRMDHAEADGRLAGTASAIMAAHDEGGRIEAKQFELVHALDVAGRIDEALVLLVLAEGEISLLAELLARRGGITFETAWEHLSGDAGQLALLLRMSGFSRELAGEIIATVADIVGSDAETVIAMFDRLTDAQAERARKWLRLDPGYRSAVDLLAAGDGKRAV